ncbi:MAG: hypothetical protein AMXMBFR33_29640 [Candidatus Xenobia bacterium]
MSMAFLNRRLDELAEVQSHEFRLIMGALAQHKRQFGTMQQSMGEMQQTVGQLQQTVGQLQQTVGQLQQTVGQLQQTVGQLQQTVGNVQDSIGEINETLEQLSSSSDLQAQAMERYNAVAEERFALLRRVLAEHEHDDPAA